jgi:formylglycine-generating enzyme
MRTAESCRGRSKIRWRQLLTLMWCAPLAVVVIAPHATPWSEHAARAAEPASHDGTPGSAFFNNEALVHSSDGNGILAQQTEVRRERPWQLVSGRFWQLAGPEGEPTEVTDAREHNRDNCPAGMVHVAGKMKTHNKFSIDGLQLQTCTQWIQREWPERCAAYDRERWLAQSKDYPTHRMDYCMDRFEYPNKKDVNPIIMVSWYEAKDSCKAQGKRLCSEDEWTFACEGEEAMPYPTGYDRDKTQCVIDEHWSLPNGEALLPRNSDHARAEVDRLFRGEASGGARSCKSSFGVYDMTGNIDEWTHSSIPGERPSILKGGYFGPVRTRCRPSTRAHSEGHVFYQQGFRCCADKPAH